MVVLFAEPSEFLGDTAIVLSFYIGNRRPHTVTAGPSVY
ncbi:hypothetical protein Pd630_LPD13020 (plasmid) [Rhodococcus opacus PD630]|nr:hypothetical protein Pd630_LPD13020 [Rhodococcus opacus PD630]